MVKSHIRQLMWNVKIGQKSLLITDSIRKFHNSGNNLIIDEQEKKCPNCDRVFTPYHQCWQMLLSVVLDCLIELHISEKKKAAFCDGWEGGTCTAASTYTLAVLPPLWQSTMEQASMQITISADDRKCSESTKVWNSRLGPDLYQNAKMVWFFALKEQTFSLWSLWHPNIDEMVRKRSGFLLKTVQNFALKLKFTGTSGL